MNAKVICTLVTAVFASVVAAAEPPQAEQNKPLSVSQVYQQILADVQSNYMREVPPPFALYVDRKPPENPELARFWLTNALKVPNNAQLKVLSDEELARIRAREGGGYAGFGIEFARSQIVLVGAEVKQVLPDSNAEYAGVRVGDVIVSVNHVPVAGSSLIEVVDWWLTGEPGSTVRLGTMRGEVLVERDVKGKLGVVLEAPGRLCWVVRSVTENTTAHAAGVRSGDVLVEANGQPIGAEESINSLLSGGLGVKSHWKLLRSANTIEVDVTREIIARGESRVMYASMRGGGQDWTQLQLCNLDWREVVGEVDQLLASTPNDSGLIVDLRGSSGQSPRIAAALLQRFLPSEPNLLTVQTRAGIQNYASGNLRAAPKVFTGKMVVLVDDRTVGSAEAIARRLQETGRATIRGVATPGHSTVCVVREYPLGRGGAIAVQIPAATFLGVPDQQPLSSVKPDRYDDGSTSLSGDRYYDPISRRAREDLFPPPWHTNPLLVFAVIIVLLVGGSAMIIFAQIRANARRQAGTTNGAAEADVAASEQPWVENCDHDRPMPLTPRENGWLRLFGIFMACLALGTVVVLYRTINPGLPGGVVVTAYVDDSAAGKAQRKLIEELSKEYSGSIQFEVVDQTDPAQRDPEITYVPNVGVTVFRRGANGQDVYRSSSHSGRQTRTELVEAIQRALENAESSGGKGLRVTRTKPVLP